MNKLHLALCASLAVALGLFAGCQPPAADLPSTSKNPIFYPAPPDPPRYQFLFSFSDAAAWKGKDRGGSFSDFIVGGDKKEEASTKIVNPYGIAVSDGKLYICDVAAYRVHVIDFANQKYSTLGDGKNLVHPLAITIGPDGTRYVCDETLRQVAVFDANDKFVRHLGNPDRCGPADVAVYGDELFVVDQPGGKVEVWSKTGELKRTIASPGKGPEQFQRPGSVAIDPNGDLYVSDVIGSAIKVFDRSGKLTRQVGEAGANPGYLARPKGLRIDAANGLLYVADPHFDTIQIFSLEGQLLLFIQEQNDLPQGMISPTWIALDKSCLPYFKKYLADGFQAEYLMFVANEFGKNKIGIYAFGKSTRPMPTTQPSRPRPATTSPAGPFGKIGAPTL